MNQEKLIENSAEKEYDFESGLREIIDRIEQLLSEQDAVVVSISGPFQNETDVGKTTLCGKIQQELSVKNIPNQSTGDLTFVNKYLAENIKFSQEKYKSKKMVIILGAEGSYGALNENQLNNLKNSQNQELKNQAAKAGLSLEKIDIRILIYRPDKEAAKEEKEDYADVVIRNDHARDKKRF